MNFFEQQSRARFLSSLLLVLLLLSVVGMIIITCLPFGLRSASPGSDETVINWEVVWTVVSVIGGIVVVAGLWEYKHLRRGGKAVAEKLDGRPIIGKGRTRDEKRLINIVEEMAIASGVSAPRLYLLPDEGINAFAAGFNAKDAVIGVTQGAISQLTRDEMQGVIAHEFSHIYNGDMRLSMQMLAVYGGLITLGFLGGMLVGSKMGVIVVLMGIVLAIGGFTGSFFVRLIEAAVSRQREFLADATAVQYTRNPQSLAGALKKIGGYAGSNICAKKARKYKHLYFATGVSSAMKGWFASHPDLSERIRRIDPQWDGVYPEDL